MDYTDRKVNLRERNKGGLRNSSTPLNLGRRVLAYEMQVSAGEIPHVCFQYEPDVTAFMAYFKEKQAKLGKKITFNTLILKCITEGMKAAPVLNSHLYYKFRSAKGTIRTFDKIDINMPTILPDGSMQALNVRDAGAGNIFDLDDKIKDLIEKARDEIAFGQAQHTLAFNQTIGMLKKGRFHTFFARVFGAYFGKERIRMHGCKTNAEYLIMRHKHNKTIDRSKAIKKEDLQEGTVVVSNIGSLKKDLNGRISLFEIIPPQVFAVMVCNLQRKPVVVSDGEERLEIRTVLPLTLAFDHRACDFGDLIPFIEKMDEIFACPRLIDPWFE